MPCVDLCSGCVVRGLVCNLKSWRCGISWRFTGDRVGACRSAPAIGSYGDRPSDRRGDRTATPRSVPLAICPRCLLRDCDSVYERRFQQHVAHFGSIRRESRDPMMVFSEGHLRCVLAGSFHYSHRWRPHLSLAMDCPEARPVQLPRQGVVVAFPEVGGLHHHYERMAA